MNDSQDCKTVETGGMDRFTRNYLIFLGLLGLALLATWASTWNPRIGEINGLLASDAVLSGYVYQFRVLELNNGVARISTPRTHEVPVVRFLGAVHPQLRGKPQDDPGLVAAQEELVRYQKRAIALVQGQPDVNSIRWVLEKALQKADIQVTSFSNAAAACRNFSASRAIRVTFAPSRISNFAVSNPIPLDPPVMMACCPSNFI